MKDWLSVDAHRRTVGKIVEKPAKSREIEV
jgi:hypothetical protein